MLIESLKYVTNNLKAVLFYSLFIILVIPPFFAAAFAGYGLIEHGIKLFSGVLLAISLLIVFLIVLFLQGYVLKLIRSRSSGDDRAPPVIPGSLACLNVMLKEGFSAIIISSVYAIIPFVLFLLLFLSVYPISSLIEYGTALTYAGESDVALLIEQVVYPIFLLIGIIILLTVYSYYIVPAPFLVYANNRKFATAFSVSEITSLLFNRAYFIGFLYVLLAVFLVTIISTVVALIPVIGALIAIPISVIGSLTVWSIWGGVYRDIYPPIES